MSGAKTWSEFAAWAKANPGKAGYATSGAGSLPHFFGVLLGRGIGVEMTHVPYKGGGPALNDLLGGQIQLLCVSTPTVQPHVRQGRLKAIAVTSPRRSLALPEVPTIAESGYPGFEADSWYGILTTGRAPASVISQLNREIQRILALPDVVAGRVGMVVELPLANSEVNVRALRRLSGLDYEEFEDLLDTVAKVAFQNSVLGVAPGN